MPVQDVAPPPSLGGFENDISNRLVAIETAARKNHDYVGRLARTVQSLLKTVDFEQQHNKVLEGRMDEYQRLGFDLNQTVRTMNISLEMRPDPDATINARMATFDSIFTAKLAMLESTLQSLHTTFATAGTAVEQNVAAVEKHVARLHGAKPVEGATITAAISQQSQRIGEIQQALHGGQSIGLANAGGSVPFTEEMRQSMENI